MVEILFNGTRIASHNRGIAHGYSTQKAHMPLAHQAYVEWTVERVLDCADKIGTQTKALVERIVSDREVPQQAFRSCLGIIRLARTWGNARVEAAADRALAANALSYKSMKLILVNGMDRKPVAQKSVVKIVQHENIRGAKYYTDGDKTDVDECDPGKNADDETNGHGRCIDVSVANA